MAEQLPRTAAEAKKMGVTQYFTGKPCKHGHISGRQTKGGNCIECCLIRKPPVKPRECSTAPRMGWGFPTAPVQIIGNPKRISPVVIERENGWLGEFEPRPVFIIGNPSRVTGVL